MPREPRIDDFIEAGWGGAESAFFDPVAFHHWRRRAFEVLIAMAGPDPVYTRDFENFVRQGGETDLRAACGKLSAAKEQSWAGSEWSKPPAK